jgi:hypothetical protein
MRCRNALRCPYLSLPHFPGQANTAPTRSDAVSGQVNSILYGSGVSGSVQPGSHADQRCALAQSYNPG